jgi:hypothetical protein
MGDGSTGTKAMSTQAQEINYGESRADFSQWKGIYETLRRRKDSYRQQLEGPDLAFVFHGQPAY